MPQKKRKAYSTMQAQLAADKRWIEKNREHRRYLSARTGARSFIRNRATEEDMLQLESLMAERRERLRQEPQEQGTEPSEEDGLTA